MCNYGRKKHQMDEAAAWNVIDNLNILIEKDKELRDLRTPDFIICGAAKAGTTSLFRYLSQHPYVYTPRIKEPGYFSAFRTYSQSPEKYASLFEPAEEYQKAGEASTAYLTSPDSALRIASAIPEVRIIIMLRNPADRAFSHYRWMTREGWEYAASFQEALHLEQNSRSGNAEFIRCNQEYYYNYLYFQSGLYYDRLKRYLNVFASNQVHFILFENFVESVKEHTQRICRFLEIDDTFDPEVKVYNKGGDVWSPHLQHFIRNKMRPVMDKISFPSRVRICSHLMKWNQTRPNRSMAPAVRSALLDRYRSDIKKTEALVDLPLSQAWL